MHFLYNSNLYSGIRNAIENRVNLSIFPNPSTGVINIRTDGIEDNGFMTIFNGAGQMVFKGYISGNSDQSLSLSGYGKGLYIIQIASGNAVGHQQVIIE